MSVSVRGIKQTRSMSNQTCHFSSISGLPPRVGVPIRVIMQPNYGLHCQATKNDSNCCCLPISSTWAMNCTQARAWLVSKGYIDANGRGPNQVCAGGVGNRALKMHCERGARGAYGLGN